MTEIASKDAYLDRRERRFVEHDVKGFGRIRLQSLSEKELQEFLRYGYDRDEETGATNIDQDKLDNSNCKLLTMTLVNEDDFQLFQDSDVETLAGVDSAVTMAIFKLADKHCSTNRDKSVKSAVGNSEETGDEE